MPHHQHTCLLLLLLPPPNPALSFRLLPAQMGMGEPLNNFDAVSRAVNQLVDPQAFA